MEEGAGYGVSAGYLSAEYPTGRPSGMGYGTVCPSGPMYAYASLVVAGCGGCCGATGYEVEGG